MEAPTPTPPMALERRRKKEERMPSYVRTYVGRGTTWVMLYKSWQHTRKRSPPSLLFSPQHIHTCLPSSSSFKETRTRGGRREEGRKEVHVVLPGELGVPSLEGRKKRQLGKAG